VASRPLGGTLDGRDLEGTQSVGGQHTCALRGNAGVKPGKVCDAREARYQDAVGRSLQLQCRKRSPRA
jgi:hypothetical protein